MPEKMNILITGGTVFVSRFVAEYFAKCGHEVYVLNRNTKPQAEGVHLIECDRHAPGARLKSRRFDAVIDVTAYTAADVNLLLDGLADFGSYFLISSSAVYPETLAVPFKENDECGANAFWGEYGEYNNVYREAFVFDCAERNVPFYLPKDGSMPLQFFHVEDLCRFIETLISLRPEQKIFNVGNAPVSVKEWVEACYAAAGKTPELISVTDGTEQRNYFPFYDYGYVLDTTAQDALLPDLLPLETGLRRAYTWYKEHKSAVKQKTYFDYIEKHFT